MAQWTKAYTPPANINNGNQFATNDVFDENSMNGFINNTFYNKDTIDAHIGDKTNPHLVTKAQVGLGNCDNTSDLDKPISIATQNAINEVKDNVYLKTDTMFSLSVENTNGSIKLNDTNFSIKNENGGLSIKPNQFVTDLKQINGDYLLPKSYTRVKDANGNVQAYYGFNNDAKMVVGSRNNNVNIIQGQIDASNQTDLKTDNAKHVIEMEDNGSLTIKSKSYQDLQIRKYVIDEEDSGWNEANIMSEINFNADFPEMQLAAYENGGQDKNNGKIEIRSDEISIKLSEDFIDYSKKTGISMNRGNIFIETAVDSGPCIYVNDNGVYLSRVDLEENRVATIGDIQDYIQSAIIDSLGGNY